MVELLPRPASLAALAQRLLLTHAPRLLERAGPHAIVQHRLAAQNLAAVRPSRLAVYLHVPFCTSRCAYCSFNTARSDGDMEAYVAAVEREMAWWGERPAVAATEVGAVFIGGGTPSVLPLRLLDRLLGGLSRWFRMRPGAQVTMECNPESLTDDKLPGWRAAGIGRLSIGVQSFDDGVLKRLGRRHLGAEARAAIERAHAAGYEELSIDLMYGLPGQSDESFGRGLREAVASPATHISLFPTVYLPGTAIHRDRERGRTGPLRDEEERLFTTYRRIADDLGAAAFEQVTTEDFTRSGVTCAYQREAWTPPAADTLGLGAGALAGMGRLRWHNVGPVREYMAAARPDTPPVAAGVELTAREHALEQVILGLHTLRVDPSMLRRDFGFSLRRLTGPVAELCWAAGLVERRSGAWVPTLRGRFIISRLWCAMILRELSRAAADSGLDEPRPARKRRESSLHGEGGSRRAALLGRSAPACLGAPPSEPRERGADREQ